MATKKTTKTQTTKRAFPKYAMVKQYGEECPDVAAGCAICEAWALFHMTGKVPTQRAVDYAMSKWMDDDRTRAHGIKSLSDRLDNLDSRVAQMQRMPHELAEELVKMFGGNIRRVEDKLTTLEVGTIPALHTRLDSLESRFKGLLADFDGSDGQRVDHFAKARATTWPDSLDFRGFVQNKPEDKSAAKVLNDLILNRKIAPTCPLMTAEEERLFDNECKRIERLREASQARPVQTPSRVQGKDAGHTVEVELWAFVGDEKHTYYAIKEDAERAARQRFPEEDPDRRYGRIFYRTFVQEL